MIPRGINKRWPKGAKMPSSCLNLDNYGQMAVL